MTRYDFMGPHEIITRHTRPRTRGRRTAPLRGYGTSQLCNSIGMLHELIPLAYEHAVTGKTLRSAIWANTALNHRQARLWLCSCSLGTALRASTALALRAQLFGRARLLSFGGAQFRLFRNSTVFPVLCNRQPAFLKAPNPPNTLPRQPAQHCGLVRVVLLAVHKVA